MRKKTIIYTMMFYGFKIGQRIWYIFFIAQMYFSTRILFAAVPYQRNLQPASWTRPSTP